MFLITVAIFFNCIISNGLPNNLLKLIADPTLPDTLFCSSDLIKVFPRDILFDGDSTIKWLYYQVKRVLEHQKCFRAINPLPTQRSEPNIFTQDLVLKFEYADVYPNDDLNKMQEFLINRFSGEEKIIIWNQGMHLLHLFPERTFENLFFTVNYKEVMRLVMESVSNKTQCVIFKTTNPIKTSKFIGEYSKYAKLYDEHEPRVIWNCTNQFKNYEVCEKAIFTNKGVRWLNEKMHQFVAEYKSEDGPKLVLMDSYSLFVNSSKYTRPGDGRHYLRIKNLEIALLKVTIEENCGIEKMF